MVSAFDEASIDFSTSCTRDVAVAKLLGWMQGPIRRRYIEINANGIPLKEMPFLYSLEGSLKDILLEMREAAQRVVLDAAQTYADTESNESRLAVDDADDSLEDINQKIYLAAEYFCAIDDELAKGVDSELRIDRVATVDSDNPYITLKSLDTWAKKMGYPLQILNPSSTYSESIPKVTEQTEEPLLNAKGGMSRTSAKSFLVTFALLIEQFIEKTGPQFKSESGSEMNLAEIAKLLCKQSLPGARAGHFLWAQSVSSIEERILEVLNVSSDTLLTQRRKEQRRKK